MATGKRKRDKKVSRGIHGGGGKVPNLTQVQKVLLGKGMYRTWKPLPGEDKPRG